MQCMACPHAVTTHLWRHHDHGLGKVPVHLSSQRVEVVGRCGEVNDAEVVLSLRVAAHPTAHERMPVRPEASGDRGE